MASCLLFFGIILLVSFMFLLPGFLLWRLISKSKNADYDCLLSIGLGFALVLLVFVTTTVIFRYSFWLMLGEIVVLIAALLIFVLVSDKLNFDFHIKEIIRRNQVLLLFFLLVFIIFMGPVFVIDVPFNTDAQGFGFNALAVREGGTSGTLVPFFSEALSLYPPGFFILTAFISDFFNGAPLHEVMLIFSHLTSFFFVVLVYYFGRHLFEERFAFAMAVFSVLGLGLFTSVLNSHYTTVPGMIFLICFLALFFENIRCFSLARTILAGLFLGAVCLTSPDTLIVLLIGWIPFYVMIFFARERIRQKEYLGSFLLIPLIGIVFALPWIADTLPFILVKSRGLVDAVMNPDFVELSLNNWKMLILFNGVLVPLMAFIGVYFASKRRRYEDVFLIVNLIAIMDFSMFGFTVGLFRIFHVNIAANFFPPNIAWSGAIIPFAFLSSCLVTGLFGQRRVLSALKSAFVKIAVILLIFFCIFMTVFGDHIIHFSKQFNIPMFGSLSTSEDVEAMLWLKYNSPKAAVVLNYPMKGKYPLGMEAHWVPVISERKTISNRNQPYFVGLEPQLEIVKRLSTAIETNDSSEFLALLGQNNVSYITIAQLSTNKSAALTAQRWKFNEIPDITDWLDSLEGVKQVYSDSGAEIYQVSLSDSGFI